LKLQFDSNLDFQIKAIQSVIDLFEGQLLNNGDFEFSLTDEEHSLQLNENGFGNNLLISKEQILENLRKVQRKNKVNESGELAGYNFSLEMETGTGKTYVYLRTIYELNKNYGFKKFVIVVPSIAIREGVLKNLEITHEHFQSLYNNTPASYDVYDSKKVSSLRGFASSNNIQILVINIDSFAKDINIINKANDKLTGKKPIEFIQSSCPIVIVDEPQNMETDKRKDAINKLNPLCTLRYSATHKFVYNLIYSLNPVQAYDLGLVKQIEVDSVYEQNAQNEAYIKLEEFKPQKKGIKVKIKIECETKNGVQQQSFLLQNGDDLFKLSNQREVYKDGYIIQSIDGEERCIEFANGISVYIGSALGEYTDDIMKMQISQTIEEHLKKEKVYKGLGIKVLSLFFIDRVANYRSYDADGNTVKGKFALWFEEIFNGLISRPRYKDVLPYPVEELHNGYFAQDSKGKFKESKTGEAKEDDSAYHLIMQDKEKLLEISTPLRFIFSHSALREGWDNPNVFQICTLNETRSEMKKRQEIGRGLRLPVYQTGLRSFDKHINRLTVVANESYDEFAKQLQNEIKDECGVEFTGRIKNKRDRVSVKIKNKYVDDEKFKELWEKIKYKTSYKVKYETEKLIVDAAKKIKEMPEIKRPSIVAEKAKIQISDEGVTTIGSGTAFVYVDGNRKTIIPDIISYVQSKTELTRTTILRILKESGRLHDIMKNPQMFLDNSVMKTKEVLDELLIDGIKYEKIHGKIYEMKLFEAEEIQAYKEHLYKVKKQDKTLYNHIEFQSSVEKEFAEACDNNESVEFYIKLPPKFKIDTPVGPYNPDWALIFKNENKIYFVAETKGSNEEMDLRKKESMKIKCGEKHFEEIKDVKFKKVTKLSELLTS
jgi:type III restriction enzyme